MESVLERLKEKKLKIKGKTDKPIFIKIESNDNRTLYHTKIMNDFYAFGIDEKRNDKFFISFRGLFNQDKIEWFSLFRVKEGDKFLGIYYGYRKPLQNLITRYEQNGLPKVYTFSKVYYIEFRFKKGSVFCYVKGIYRLIKKERLETKYNKLLLSRMIKLEEQIYEFYNKKLYEGGVITKWIQKNLK
ncbi:DUF226 domain-containing protein (plasmid) [Borrelia miyamotoi]|uniref:DUF226 domain-containing protein n=1 Tax=Borrelia miyamotoi TaxID=47466 RepID=A0A481YGJ2_9SPIR|nr:DUF226 domain-containing protein [Borrelia miyamotoi]ATQ19167.1 DUF226 domain-containing protein [Borrelia miyamotoi]QBK62588.1 DUF226 domain-containing protein [Borrelia miyamotoi]QBK63875.1 DUF226 domain-containing protein [Borrelia miyamotoi]QBK65186.1 DUF226 domain-containing protein [Borrelia miyamotoi]QBK66441.1 DUF226 domain-containing protein [Borrelia miyamotoi]